VRVRVRVRAQFLQPVVSPQVAAILITKFSCTNHRATLALNNNNAIAGWMC
jgi:hypothetical protein